MRNYLLYFFVLLIWASLIPFTPALFGSVQEENSAVESEKYKVLTSDGTIAEMTLDEYVLGVMLSEMPASYEKQALFAQAIAIRSYTVYLLEENKNRHSTEDGTQYDLCSNDDCCRKYITYNELVVLAGETNAAERFATMRAAVSETSGEILTYNGKTAMTLYHISSPGRTEGYENAFGVVVPYLRGVDNVDESGFIYYKKEAYYSFADFQVLLNSNGYQYTYTEGELFFPTPNENARSTTVTFGNSEIAVASFVKMVGLNSTCIEIIKDATGYIIRSYGYGSGLGMSQYGANILASQGSSYQDILKFYFKDTIIEKR